jgi:hypothetical protein
MRYIRFLLLFLISNLQAYELIEIITVSKQGESFITRANQNTEYFVGQEAAFLNDNLNIKAKLVEYSNRYLVWEVSDPNAKVYFKKGEYLVFDDTVEYVDRLARPEGVKETISFMSAKFSFAGGFSSSSSSSSSSTLGYNEGSRSINSFEAIYFFPTKELFYLGVGFKVTNSSHQFSTDIYDSSQTFILGSIAYQFKHLFAESYHLDLALNIGLGSSKTETTTTSLSGNAYILPSIRSGISKNFSEKFQGFAELEIENVISKETNTDGSVETGHVNTGLGFGVKYFF